MCLLLSIYQTKTYTPYIFLAILLYDKRPSNQYKGTTQNDLVPLFLYTTLPLKYVLPLVSKLQIYYFL